MSGIIALGPHNADLSGVNVPASPSKSTPMPKQLGSNATRHRLAAAVWAWAPPFIDACAPRRVRLPDRNLCNRATPRSPPPLEPTAHGCLKLGRCRYPRPRTTASPLRLIAYWPKRSSPAYRYKLRTDPALLGSVLWACIAAPPMIGSPRFEANGTITQCHTHQSPRCTTVGTGAPAINFGR